MTTPDSILRSLLFAPANHDRRAMKALESQADGAILDIEDAVAAAEKSAARARVRALLAQRTRRMPRAIVRINALTTPFAYDDLCAVVGPGLDAVVVPKTETAQQIGTVDWLLTQLERTQGLPEGRIEVLPIIETAAGLCNAREIAHASGRVRRLNFGAGDFSLDTNMLWTVGHEGLLWARIQLVIVSRAAGLEPPIDTVFADLANPDGFEREALQAQQLGFAGKACIHPSQVDVVNRIFTPSDEEVARAREIVDAFEAALQQGTAAIQVHGQFIDYPVAEKAQRVLARAAAARAERGENA